jgi:hypothetical protein
MIASAAGFSFSLTALAAPIQIASGEAKADPFSLAVILYVVFWFLVGLIGTITWRKTEIWFWPLLFLFRGAREGKGDGPRESGESFGGGGASGSW